MSEQQRIKPVMVLPKGQMSQEDIAELRANQFCVVEAEDPSTLRFLEPPPEGYDAMDRAAIQLMRRLVTCGNKNDTFYRGDISRLLAELLMGGKVPEPVAQVQRVKRQK
jgi:hypothetical protein